jgi:predicted permease
MASGLLPSFVAAIQASLSVLLVITYGAIAAHLQLLDSKNGKAISKICVKMFLPALLLVKLGSEMHIGSAHRYLIVLVWALIAHVISFLIGVFAHKAFGMPDWITCAIMFNNTTSYPLLLIQSLDETGILEALMVGDESTKAMIERAKSYFLVFSTVSSCLTFAVGPRLIDTEHAPDSDDEGDKGEGSQATLVSEDADDVEDLEEGIDGVDERTLLLDPDRARNRERHLSVSNITFFPSKPTFTTIKRRPHYISLPKWTSLSLRTKWWLLFFYDFLNAPLIGAVLGAIIGLAPPLHRAFFANSNEGGWFTAWLTESWKNVGQLFVPLPLIVAGISLYTAYQEARHTPDGGQKTRIPLATTSFILVIRFLVWPAFSISLIYAIVKSQGRGGLLGEDPMLWFTMMLMPAGPPAMKLITMIQVSNAGVEDERRIAKILTISYVVSPVLAFTVVGALKASQAAI